MRFQLFNYSGLLLISIGILFGGCKKEEPKIKKDAIFYYNRLDDCPFIFRIDSVEYAAKNPEVIENSLKTTNPLPVVIEYQLLNETDNCGFFRTYSNIKLFSVAKR